MAEETKRMKIAPTEDQPTAEIIKVYYGPNKMGFDVCWTAPLNLAESVQQFHPATCSRGYGDDSNYVPGYLKSPAFEALCRNWFIGANYEYYESRFSVHGMSVSGGVGGICFEFALNLATDEDSSSNKMMMREGVDDDDESTETRDWMNGDPLFDTPGVRLDISIFTTARGVSGNGKKEEKILLPKQIRCYYEPLRELLNKQLITLDVKKGTTLWYHLHGSLRPLKMLFELRVMTGGSGGSNGAENISVRKRQISTMEKMAQNLKNSLDTGKFADFTIRTGDGREIRAHRLILAAASPYFEAMFEMEGGKEARDGEMSVPEPYAVISEIVRFLYTGRPPPPNEAESEVKVLDLFVAADKYQIMALKEYYEPIVNSSLFSIENVCDRYVDAHKNLEEKGWMKAKAIDFIRSHRSEVAETEGWRRLLRDQPRLVVALLGPA